MKILEKFVLIIYSLLILIISSIMCLLIFRLIDIQNITEWIELLLTDASLTIIALAISIICILLSIRCLFFRNRKKIKKSTTTDILLENDSGRLLISQNAIENAVKNIVSDVMPFNPETKVIADIDPANNISIYISILLDKNIKIKDLILALQIKVKDTIKENFDLDIKQVNIKVDSIEKQENKKENQKKEISNEIKKEADTKNIIEAQKSTVE
ncbi:MAG: alkaline shock response membrane anchor protein AmaP [Clostridia bacterium]|nr:alkaline shock response membrane anchor protein AmaP [Clostridia bacterium]